MTKVETKTDLSSDSFVFPAPAAPTDATAHVLAPLYREGGVPLLFSEAEKDPAEMAGVCEKHAVFDAYFIRIGKEKIEIFYTTDASRLYAAYSLRRLTAKQGIPTGTVYNRYNTEVRGFKTYLPSLANLDRFLDGIETLVSFGYNAVMLEMGGAVEYKSHPEINKAWKEYCADMYEYNGKCLDVQRCYKFPKDSIHIFNGCGDVYTPADCQKIIDRLSPLGVEIVPEVPNLSHADYLLIPHPEMSEDPDDPYPNNACPAAPGYYDLVFDVLSDVIDIFHPKRINVCHDEAYVIGVCPVCRKTDAGVILARDLTKLRDFLAGRGVIMMIWGDKIAKTWHGGSAAVHVRTPARGPISGRDHITYKEKDYPTAGFRCYSVAEFKEYMETNFHVDGWYVRPTAHAMDLIPYDIEVCNWGGPKLAPQYLEHGMTQYISNYSPSHVKDNAQILLLPKNRGFFISNWGIADRINLQRNGVLFELAYGALIAQSDERMYANHRDVRDTAAKLLNEVLVGSAEREIRITHTALTDTDKMYFYDGAWVDVEESHIGDYRIVYKDGGEETVPVLFGYNVGVSAAHIPLYTSEDVWGQKSVQAIGATEPTVIGGENRSVLRISARAEVESVTYVPKEGHENDLSIYSIEY